LAVRWLRVYECPRSGLAAARAWLLCAKTKLAADNNSAAQASALM